MISPLLETVAPDVYETYERDHPALDLVFETLNQAVSARDPLKTARATKVFKFHLDLHLDKEDTDVYQLIGHRVPLSEQSRALGQMGTDMPPNRFPEFVHWMFPLVDKNDRVNMTRGWQMGMPPEVFAGAARLIEQAGATTGPSSPARSLKWSGLSAVVAYVSGSHPRRTARSIYLARRPC